MSKHTLTHTYHTTYTAHLAWHTTHRLSRGWDTQATCLRGHALCTAACRAAESRAHLNKQAQWQWLITEGARLHHSINPERAPIRSVCCMRRVACRTACCELDVASHVGCRLHVALMDVALMDGVRRCRSTLRRCTSATASCTCSCSGRCPADTSQSRPCRQSPAHSAPARRDPIHALNRRSMQ